MDELYDAETGLPVDPTGKIIPFPRRVIDNDEDMRRYLQAITIRPRPGVTYDVIDEAARYELEALKQRFAEDWI